MQKYVSGRNSMIADTAIIKEGCIIGDDVIIHDYVVLYEGTMIGDGSEIFEHTTIGRPPKITSIMVSKTDAAGLQPTIVGEGCVIGTNVTIYSGCKLGNAVLIGDGCRLRECAKIGNEVLLAANATINHHVTIGDKTKLFDLSHLTSRSTIEDEVFIAPGVMSANDNEMRISGSPVNTHIIIRKGAKIGAGAVVLPDIKIGEKAIVSAQSVVTKNVEENTVVVGVPARIKS